MSDDKEKLEKKYNEKRQALKELEKVTSQHIITLEREKAVIEEKMASTERKL
jgi:hypothetical protein